MKNIQKTVFKVADFINWQQSGSLVLSPAFQRRPVWPPGAKSLLIDTVFQGIPMPIVFLRDRTDLERLTPIREVVDGQQRLRTLISFIDHRLLPDYIENRDSFTVQRTHNPELAAKRFQELPASARQAILNYEFSVHVLPSDTEDREVLQIFARMNATGLKLKPQELRNAEYFGVFKQLMYSLALEQLDRWRAWGIFTETDIARMQEVEEVSDLVITMLDGVHGKTQEKIDDHYKKYDDRFPVKDEVARRFHAVIEDIDSIVGSELPELQFRRKTLFHTLFSLFYDLKYGMGAPMEKAKPRQLPKGLHAAILAASKDIAAGDLPEDLIKLLRGATSHLPSRKARLEFLYRSLHGIE